MAKYVYPAIFHHEEDGGFSIFFPDIPGCFSQGDDIADGIFMANDALALSLYSMEKDGKTIPPSTPLNKIEVEDDDFVTYISADTLEYQKKFNSKAVKKTLSIPEWMNEAAVAANLNFSQLLQDAIKERLSLA